MIPDGTWGFRLTGDFQHRHATHLIVCPDEATARRRHAWWAHVRPDVIAVLVVRRGRRWVELEPTPDVLADAA